MLRTHLLAMKYDPDFGTTPDQKQFDKYEIMSATFARDLVGYESPKLATVALSCWRRSFRRCRR